MNVELNIKLIRARMAVFGMSVVGLATEDLAIDVQRLLVELLLLAQQLPASQCVVANSFRGVATCVRARTT